MADLLGNSVFFAVLLSNAIRHFLIRSARPRAQSLLDGLVYGFRGFLLDAFMVTSLQQLLLQTRIAYQDWGNIWATIVFCVWLLKLPLGPFLGALNFAASCGEGLAHILLHEEAQFAPFEPQRTVESEAWSPFWDIQDAFRDDAFADRSSVVLPSLGRDSTEPAPEPEVPKKWWLFQMRRVARIMADDEEVMDRVRRTIQPALQT
uniref:Uncharacterized protein n=1 Tax=Zooxanthella nutricula TaxID=1333877 RepID=A0A7S2KXE0_9DINO